MPLVRSVALVSIMACCMISQAVGFGMWRTTARVSVSSSSSGMIRQRGSTAMSAIAQPAAAPVPVVEDDLGRLRVPFVKEVGHHLFMSHQMLSVVLVECVSVMYLSPRRVRDGRMLPMHAAGRSECALSATTHCMPPTCHAAHEPLCRLYLHACGYVTRCTYVYSWRRPLRADLTTSICVCMLVSLYVCVCATYVYVM